MRNKNQYQLPVRTLPQVLESRPLRAKHPRCGRSCLVKKGLCPGPATIDAEHGYQGENAVTVDIHNYGLPGTRATQREEQIGDGSSLALKMHAFLSPSCAVSEAWTRVPATIS